MTQRHELFLAVIVLLSLGCYERGHAPSPTEPSTPPLPRIAGNYNATFFFVCKVNQDLPTYATESITIVQEGPNFSAALPRGGFLRGTLLPNGLSAEANYTFDSSTISTCPCAIKATNGTGSYLNAKLQGITFSEGTASHCEYGNFLITLESPK